MEEPPPLPPQRPKSLGNSWFHHAATASACAPVFAFGTVLAANLSRLGQIDIRPFAGAVLAVGILAGIVSLFGIGRYGKKPIVERATLGILGAALLAGFSWGGQNWLLNQARTNVVKGRVDSFKTARAIHVTRLTRKVRNGEAPPEPPADIFKLVKYETELGLMDAYLGVDPGDGRKHPAIIWKFGGFSNSIDENAWVPGSPDNDQSASPFREAGIVMMYPSVRGGNLNPGYVECGFGEVDDLIAAARYLKQLPYVNPDRVYLGGHSVGGTFVLLTAAAAPTEFRAVFSLGPVANIANYPKEYLAFDLKNEMDEAVRAPIRWLHEIKSPTFVFEGGIDGNDWDVLKMARNNRGAAEFFVLQESDHFNLIRPLTSFLARKILNDTDGKMTITPGEVRTGMVVF